MILTSVSAGSASLRVLFRIPDLHYLLKALTLCDSEAAAAAAAASFAHEFRLGPKVWYNAWAANMVWTWAVSWKIAAKFEYGESGGESEWSSLARSDGSIDARL